jgi:hypothetical protein
MSTWTEPKPPGQVGRMREDAGVDERRVPHTAVGRWRLLQTITAATAAVEAVHVAVERPDTPCVEGYALPISPP